MKKIFTNSSSLALILTLIFSLTLFFTGCKKYDEGPLLSFRSAYNRIEGYWSIEKYTVNETDYTQLFIDSLGDFVFIYVNDPGDGVDRNEISITKTGQYPMATWVFQDNFSVIYFIFDPYNENPILLNLEPFGESQKSTWGIKKLTKNEFKLETNFENNDYKLILKK
jgi:hypothetical protein